MIILAMLLAALAGIALGLVGAGGSILVTPILLYVLGLPPREAIATSLVIVAVTAIFALVSHARAGAVEWKQGLSFGAAGMAGSMFGAIVAKEIPESFLIGGFALLMWFAAYRMLVPVRVSKSNEAPARWGRMVLVGAGTGMITGMVGAGGGFVVVPALLILGRMPMTRAIGTSLLVIGMQAGAGALTHAFDSTIRIDLALALSVVTAISSAVASGWSRRIDTVVLKKAFAAIVVVIATLMIGRLVSERLTVHASAIDLAGQDDIAV